MPKNPCQKVKNSIEYNSKIIISFERNFNMLLTKIHSVGNDYLIADCFDDIFDNAEQYAAKVCDRHLGIGADALILLMYSNDADFRTEVYDVYGDKIQASANALICAAKFALDNDITNKTTVSIQTENGVKYVTASDNGYTANLGQPVLTPQLIPVDYTGDLFIDKTITVSEENYTATCVSVCGKPCTVIFADDGAELNGININKVAPFIEEHNIFPAGTNVILTNVVERNLLQARCWLLSEGEVVGCDFGAAAAFMASSLKGIVDDAATVELHGGDAKIEISDDDFLYMTTKPEKVFHIEW